MKKITFFISALLVSAMSMAAAQYKLVTKVSDLKAGSKYVIASAKTGEAVLMGNADNANNRKVSAKVAIEDFVLTSGEDALILQLGASGSDWTFETVNYEGTAGYLNATNTTKSNYLKVVAALDNYANFSISFDTDSSAVITCTGKAERNLMRYNSSSSIMACYTSGQAPVYLFVKVGEEKRIPVTDIELDQHAVTIQEGKTVTLVATIAPDSATDKSVTWTSLDEDIATVEKGVVTGVAEGEVMIVVASKDSVELKDTCVVTVEKGVQPTGGDFKLVTDASVLRAGDTLILGATVDKSSFAAGAFGTNKYFSSQEATVVDSTIVSENAIAIVLGGAADNWTFTTSEGLVGTKAAKALVLNDKDATTTWTISIDKDNNAIITSTGEGLGSIQYNSGSPRFLNYATTQKPIQLYRKAGKPSEPVQVSGIAAVKAMDTVMVNNMIKLNYTITPSNATDQRVEFAITSGSEYATINGKELTGVAEGDVVVVATAIDSLNTGDKLSATFNIHVKAEVLNTCAEVNAVTTEKNVPFKLNPVTVVYAIQSNLYVKDESGSALIFFASGLKDNLEAGDVVAGIQGKSSPYNGLPELVPTNDSAKWVITSGLAPEIPTADAAPVAADANKVMVWKGVQNMEGEFTDASKTNITGQFGKENILFRNNFKLAYSFAQGKSYDITGAVAIYNTTIQVYFLSAEESPATGMDGIESDAKVIKTIENGQVIIIRNGVRFNVAGQMIK